MKLKEKDYKDFIPEREGNHKFIHNPLENDDPLVINRPDRLEYLLEFDDFLLDLTNKNKRPGDYDISQFRTIYKNIYGPNKKHNFPDITGYSLRKITELRNDFDKGKVGKDEP